MEIHKQKIPLFLVEACGLGGVKRIADKVAKDVEKVFGSEPERIENLPEGKGFEKGESMVLFATLGESPLTKRLIEEGKFDSSEISGKREVYQIKILENPFPGINQALFICGSDKRGTIYGMFALSEYIGVSPLHYWGDAEPEQKERIEITKEIETISKEPSIKYRGFFINDEWPCFGNWTFTHFNGFTAEMYDHVFELLLRLKGNYLWPAMWTSSFALDGPGNQNQELADLYGVVMGASHHEPCLRASEEWDLVRGVDSIYGNEWNYYTNREGLLRYWEDGLKRSGVYENIITIGMRGERDSSMLGENSTLKDNIDLLKDIITNQQGLIKKHINKDLNQVPLLLALYKEVEEYFYGNEEVPGLKDWDALDGVTCMLCEDNFGFMRTLPTEDIKNRKGGFGMYYHFDYHGGPISYEWMPSTPISKVWEQMTMAYDYGIRDVWMVNVGDLKFNEVSLAYFMNLAYDFESWGSSAPNSWGEYHDTWVKHTFPTVDKSLQRKMAHVLEQYVSINGKRRPEALNASIYHPCNYLETDRMLDWANEIHQLNEEVYEQLKEREKDAYYSMIYFPAKVSINLLRMHLYAGKNVHYALQGKTVANQYARLITACIKEDRDLSEEFAGFRKGKWKGMELEQHIGFVKWNEDNSRYPLRMEIEPAYKPRMTISRKDSEEIAVKNYGAPMELLVEDFLYEGNKEVILEIANDGIGTLDYTIEIESKECSWLTITPMKGTVKQQEEVLLQCDREKLPQETETIRILIRDEETCVAVVVKGKAIHTKTLPWRTFLENNGVITMEADHYCRKQDTSKGEFLKLEGYGRSGRGMKVFPTMVHFTESEEKPSLTYRFLTEHTGDYVVEVWMTPTNSVKYNQPLRFLLTDSGGNNQVIEAVSPSFRTGNPAISDWCAGVLNQIRICKGKISLEKGIQEITLGAMEAGLVLERILVYPEGKPPKVSYLGPKESFFCRNLS